MTQPTTNAAAEMRDDINTLRKMLNGQPEGDIITHYQRICDHWHNNCERWVGVLPKPSPAHNGSVAGSNPARGTR